MLDVSSSLLSPHLLSISIVCLGVPLTPKGLRHRGALLVGSHSGDCHLTIKKPNPLYPCCPTKVTLRSYYLIKGLIILISILVMYDTLLHIVTLTVYLCGALCSSWFKHLSVGAVGGSEGHPLCTIIDGYY